MIHVCSKQKKVFVSYITEKKNRNFQWAIFGKKTTFSTISKVHPLLLEVNLNMFYFGHEILLISHFEKIWVLRQKSIIGHQAQKSP